MRSSLLLGLLVVYAVSRPAWDRWSASDSPPPPSTSSDSHRPEIGESGSPTTPDDLARESVPSGRLEAEEPSSIDESVTKLGELREIGGNVFRSTAGLHYRPGSQEGHRVKHVLRHHQDDPDRPVHGVFEGDRNEVFATIDEAYLYTFDHGPPRVTSEVDDGRTIYLVDLGRRIGYVGGQKGKRNGFRVAHHLQLILDGTNVITAYPVRVEQGRQ